MFPTIHDALNYTIIWDEIIGILPTLVGHHYYSILNMN